MSAYFRITLNIKHFILCSTRCNLSSLFRISLDLSIYISRPWVHAPAGIFDLIFYSLSPIVPRCDETGDTCSRYMYRWRSPDRYNRGSGPSTGLLIFVITDVLLEGIFTSPLGGPSTHVTPLSNKNFTSHFPVRIAEIEPSPTQLSKTFNISRILLFQIFRCDL